MANKLGRSILAGIVATAVMTGVTFMAPMMGFPKMNPAEMLSGDVRRFSGAGMAYALYDRNYFRCCVCLFI